MEHDVEHSNALLYSDGVLHLLQDGTIGRGATISLARLTEEPSTIRLVLSNWAQLDASFSESSTPTAGLVGFLSNAASSGDTWMDDDRCVNARVTKAAKVENGFKFTGPGSRATWPVNGREDRTKQSFVNHDFTLVATVMIRQVPSGSSFLQGAGLGNSKSKKFIGLPYSMDKTWKTVFNGTKTAPGGTWEPGKEYQVALMLQGGNKELRVRGWCDCGEPREDTNTRDAGG
ncbi:putative trans-sialidase [Trypanosoma cruzi]|nr:putative trans-sialidase [Trypanosoma cruzi]